MTKNVIAVSLEDMVDRVFILFNFEAIRPIPALENNRVVGIHSVRDQKNTGTSKRKCSQR